jgi:hypothetical protein
MRGFVRAARQADSTAEHDRQCAQARPFRPDDADLLGHHHGIKTVLVLRDGHPYSAGTLSVADDKIRGVFWRCPVPPASGAE